jgi:ABC-type spermidine/putrescine transport system permease subunit II
MNTFGERLLAQLWSKLGLVAFVLYLLVTIALMGALLFDASHVFNAPSAIDWSGITRYAWNSVLVGVPSATLCVIAGAYLAYRLRFVATRHAVLAVIVLLTPYFSSAVGLYVGLKVLFGASPVAFAVGLILRYLPVCTIVFLLSLQTVPVGIRRAATNLQISGAKLFWRVVAPVIGSTAGLLFIFLAALMPLDVIGSTVAGGGQLQTFGNLIADYSRTRDNQSVASLLTVVFIAVAGIILFSFLGFARRRGEHSYKVRSTESLPNEPLRTVYLNPVFLLFVGVYLAILFALLRQRADVGSELSNLWAAFRLSAVIIIPITIMTVTIAFFLGCWLHLANLRHAASRERLVLAALVIPTLLPPILAGRIGAVAQGLLNVSGDGLTVAIWYVYFFGAVPILVVTSHPFVEHNVLAHVAANHGVARSDYVMDVLMPALAMALLVGGCLFGAIAMSDAVIVRYVGGATKTLGLVLADHQAGVLSPGDYVFLGGLGLYTLAAILLAAIMMYAGQRKASLRVGQQLPTTATRRS